VVMDADLQDPPELLPEMFLLMKQGYDVVSAQRRLALEMVCGSVPRHQFSIGSCAVLWIAGCFQRWGTSVSSAEAPSWRSADSASNIVS